VNASQAFTPLPREGVKELREGLEHVPLERGGTSGGSLEIRTKSWFNSGYPLKSPLESDRYP